MSVRIAINGFGRIGRNVLRAIVEANRKDVTVVAINDLAPPETNAHLLRFDSVHGRFPGEVVSGEQRRRVQIFVRPVAQELLAVLDVLDAPATRQRVGTMEV